MGNATPSNHFQLPLINSHWKMLPFMPSFHHSKSEQKCSQKCISPSTFSCSLFIRLLTRQEHWDTKGPTPTGERWLNLTLQLCAARRSSSVSSPQLCTTYLVDTSVFNRAREPLNPLSDRIQFKQFSWSILYCSRFQDLWCRQNHDIFLCTYFLTKQIVTGNCH